MRTLALVLSLALAFTPLQAAAAPVGKVVVTKIAVTGQTVIPKLAVTGGLPVLKANQGLVNPLSVNVVVPGLQNPMAALQETGAQLGESKPGEQGGILNQVFDGGTAQLGDLGGEVSGSLSAGVNPLAQFSASDLQAAASDASKPSEERSSAVKALAERGEKESLKAVGASNPEGGAQDYEIKRQALRALANLGEVVSLPPVSAAHAQEILSKISAQKPGLAVFDYDGTLAPYKEKIGADTAKSLSEASKEVPTAILTDRPDVQESISEMTAEQKSSLLIGENRGARISLYEKDGKANLVRQEPVLTGEQKFILQKAADATKAAYGVQEYKGKTQDLSDYGFAVFLPIGMSKEKVAEAAAAFKAQVGAEFDVVGRNAYKPEDPPYITVSKLDKSLGVTLLRQQSSFMDRLRSAPAALRRFVLKPKASDLVAAKSTLVVGDHFFGQRTVDSEMIKGAPGALAIAVGGQADPRLDNIFVWPTQGAEGSRQILGALSKKNGGDPQKNVLVGMFAQRTVSIVAFLLTTLAYPFIAIPVVGVAGFGALMALGPLAAIATGPLNGLIAQRLSARNAMAVNTVVRIVLALALPVFAGFGVLNFWTLLIASIANGWLLSSIMTTEGIYMKRFAGQYVGSINALAMINYLAIQVVLGLIIGVGSYVDKWNLMIPYYISAAAHALIVLPIIWKTIPNIIEKPAAAPAAGAAPAKKFFEVGPFFKRYWKEAALFAAGIALFPLIHTTIPAAAALIYWVSRTQGFKDLWAQKNLRYAMLFSGLAAMLFFPMQSMLLPVVATTLAGAAGKSLALGQLLGALFFGQLISNAGQAKLPDVKLPLIGSVKSPRLVQAVVLALAATWVGLKLFPGSLLAVGGAVALGAGLMWLAEKMNNRGWMRTVGIGLSAIMLPLLFGFSMPVFFTSLLMLGLFYGPGTVAVSSYFFGNVPREKSESMIAVQGSFFNGAISLGYGLMTLLTALVTPAGQKLPELGPLLWVLGPVFIVAGLVYTLAPKMLPEKKK